MPFTDIKNGQKENKRKGKIKRNQNFFGTINDRRSDIRIIYNNLV